VCPVGINIINQQIQDSNYQKVIWHMTPAKVLVTDAEWRYLWRKKFNDSLYCIQPQQRLHLSYQESRMRAESYFSINKSSRECASSKIKSLPQARSRVLIFDSAVTRQVRFMKVPIAHSDSFQTAWDTIFACSMKWLVYICCRSYKKIRQ